MVEVDNSAYGKTMDNLSGWLCSEEEVLPAIQKGLQIVAAGIYVEGTSDRPTSIEEVIVDVYFLFLNGDI